MSPTKSVHISNEQHELLLNYMEQHPNFHAGKFPGLNGRELLRSEWEALASLLNAQGGGCTKDVSKWKESWLSWKRNTKAKAAKIKTHQRGTGGGRPIPTKLNEIEERLVRLLGEDIIFGMPGVKTFGVHNVEYPPLAVAEQATAADEECDWLCNDQIIIECNLDLEPLKSNDIAMPQSVLEGESSMPATDTKRPLKRKSSGKKASAPDCARQSSYFEAVNNFMARSDKNIKIAEESASTMTSFLPFLKRWAIAAERTAVASEESALAARETAAAVSESAASARETAAATREKSASPQEIAALAKETAGAARDSAAAAQATSAAALRIAAAARESAAAAQVSAGETATSAPETDVAAQESAAAAQESAAAAQATATAARATAAAALRRDDAAEARAYAAEKRADAATRRALLAETA